MSTHEVNVPGTDRQENDKKFVRVIGEDVDTLYLHSRATIMSAMSAQENIREHSWPNADIAEHSLRHVVRNLERQAQADNLISQRVTLSGPTLDLPEAQIDQSRRGAMITPHEIGPDEFIEQTFIGAEGQFSGFHYIITEKDDGTATGRLVYQVIVGTADTANMHALLFASADVGHDTNLEFAYDHQFRELEDAIAVFESVNDDGVLMCAKELRALLANDNNGDYSVENLHRIAYIVLGLSTHIALKDVRQPAFEALETIVTTLMPVRIGQRPRVISHTGGLYQYYTDDKATQLSSLQPYIQESDEQPITLDPAHITQVTLMPGDKDPILENVEPDEIPYEPHLVIRLNWEIRYIPLSKITGIA